MRGTVVIGVAVWGAASLAFGQVRTVSPVSENIVGYTRKTVSAGAPQMLAPPFTGLIADSMRKTLGTNGVPARIYADGGERLYCWNVSRQTFEDGAATEQGGGMVAMAGRGSTNTTEVLMMGNVVTKPVHEQEVVPGYQVLGVPFSATMAIKDLNFEGSGATAGASPDAADQMYVWDGKTRTYRQYALKAGGGWREVRPANRWSEEKPTKDTIEMGEGFWYVAKGKFVWRVKNPYGGK